MNNATMLQVVLRYVLGIPVGVDVTSVKYGDAPAGAEWDSLRHMVLCTMIEDQFNVMIDIELISRIRSYADAITILTELGVDFDV